MNAGNGLPVLAHASLGLLLLSACAAPPLTELPANPCDLLTNRQVAAAADVEISGVHRVLGQQESLEASTPGRKRPAGSICRYETPSKLGSIALLFPERRGPLGSRLVAPECAAPTSWTASEDGRVRVSGGTASVCVGPNLVVWISVQMSHEPMATNAATGVARAILRRLPG